MSELIDPTVEDVLTDPLTDREVVFSGNSVEVDALIDNYIGEVYPNPTEESHYRHMYLAETED